MILAIICLAVWVVIGVINLHSEKIEKSSYATTWLLLVMYLLFDVLKEVF